MKRNHFQLSQIGKPISQIQLLAKMHLIKKPAWLEAEPHSIET
jgi:hypothetical protein